MIVVNVINASVMARKKVSELFSLVHYRGLPGFFVTIYFCDMYSKPAMRMILSASTCNHVVVSDVKVTIPHHLETSALIIAPNPRAAAVAFNWMFHIVLRHVYGIPSSAQKQLNVYYRVRLKCRGFQ